MSRYYKLNGRKLPSVTTITGQLDKSALMYWAANCACDYVLSRRPQINPDDTPEKKDPCQDTTS